MSDTDETDELLLIPPNRFLSNIELPESYVSDTYFGVVGTLITQVCSLEDRLNSIEDGGGGDITMDRGEQKDQRFYDCGASSYSTPQKPRSKYRVSSLPASPNVIRGAISPNKTKSRQQMLREIDEFINEKASSVRCKLNYPESKVDMKEVDEMLRDIQRNKFGDTNETQMKVSSTIGKLVALPIPSVETFTNEENSCVSTPTTAKRKDCSSNSMSTIENVHKDVLNVLSFHKNLKHNEAKNFLSLKDLWTDRTECSEDGCKTWQERIHEEKLRRQHCEQLIKELQSRSLELQERLAVAVEVDLAKDKAIGKFHDAWDQIGVQIETINQERQSLEEDIKNLKRKLIDTQDDCSRKISHYEAEASKALNLAHSNQVKLTDAEERNAQLLVQINQITERLTSIECTCKSEIEKNECLEHAMAQKDEELNEGRAVLVESRKEVAQCKIAIETCQAELAHLKAQSTHLELVLNDKLAAIKDLEGEKNKYKCESENLKLHQKSLESELNKSKNSGEKTKMDLRNFYQEQVEMVVREKLKEFQEQLDKAEQSLQEEVKNREVAIAKTAASHIQQLTEKHNLEINLLEEKHKEEVRLYQVQISQTQQKVERLNAKLKYHAERKMNMAQQLHKVMEAQWMEAIKIINNVKTPTATADLTIDRLNHLKTKSYSNVEEVLSDHRFGDEKNDLATCSNLKDNLMYETPVNCKPKTVEDDFPKYVHMLLNRAATEKQATLRNGIGDFSSDERNVAGSGFLPTSLWNGTENTNENGEERGRQKRFGGLKPPWK